MYADIDECVAKPPPCARCKNKPGGYDCPTPLNITALLSVGKHSFLSICLRLSISEPI